MYVCTVIDLDISNFTVFVQKNMFNFLSWKNNKYKSPSGFDLMSPITLKMKYLVPHIRYSEIFPTE